MRSLGRSLARISHQGACRINKNNCNSMGDVTSSTFAPETDCAAAPSHGGAGPRAAPKAPAVARPRSSPIDQPPRVAGAPRRRLFHVRGFPRAPRLRAPEHAPAGKILRDNRGPWVESTTGAVVGRHNPIYTHSVSSRRSANRTCGFPASGSLRDHAFAHGRLRVVADRLTSPRSEIRNSSGKRVVPCPPILCFRHSHRRSR